MKKRATPQHLEMIAKKQRQALVSLYFELRNIHEIAISCAKDRFNTSNGYDLITKLIEKRLDVAELDLLDEYELHNPIPLINPKDNRGDTSFTKNHDDMVSLGNSLKSLFILEDE